MLRLGIHQLPAAEVVLVRTLLRLFAHDHDFRWRLVEQSPYDALIVDGCNSASGVPPQAKAILNIVRKSELDAGNCVARPLRPDQLKKWLEVVQHTLPEAQPLRQVVQDPGQEKAETAFKLRRWPPVSLLRRDPVRIRMATLLARRYLSMSELASMTGLNAEDVQLFMHNLKQVGLVDVRQPSDFPRIENAAKPKTTEARGFFSKGLIGGIRKRLGL